ncbi:hypothetical protein GALL_108600 [mine drainage metagenome]|uniref:Zinc-ribbon 15 domain-containing protein n=1 Tax=mine drainage metagenome TaxID=410659 RepID=A0A1J5SF53_9ZZZZ
MFVIGHNTKLLASESISAACPNCGNKNCLELTLYQKYVHFFYIPFWPIKKTTYAQCSHCKVAIEEKEMPSSLQIVCTAFRKNIKTPLYMYAGIAVFAILIAISVCLQKQNDKQNQALLSSPQTGDIVEVNAKPDEFTIGKIVKVSGDSVFLLWHQYVVNKEEGLNDLVENKKEFSDITSFVLKPDLLKMLKEKKILKVIRK